MVPGARALRDADGRLHVDHRTRRRNDRGRCRVLARPKADNPLVAERFEIYLCGVELANGFGELNDAPEQRRRLAAQMEEKERIYKERYPIDDDFISALRIMPAASGVALGFDRL